MLMQVTFKSKDGERIIVKITDQPVTIGRSAKCEIVLRDDNVSRQHCRISLWDGEYIVKDLDSANGTFVNGERVDEAVLKNGDLVACGDTNLMVMGLKTKGVNTIISELAAEMAEKNQGCRTVMRKIVRQVDLKSGGTK